MANVILTPQILTNELLRRFKNNLGFAKVAHHEDYRQHYGKKGAKIGDTLNLRVPVKFVANEGKSLVIQDITENKIPLVVNRWFNTAFGIDTDVMTLSVDNVGSRYLESAAIAQANKIEVEFLVTAYRNTPNNVGVPGSGTAVVGGASPYKLYLQALSALDRNSAPADGDRNVFITTDAQVEVIDYLKNLFQDSSQIKAQYLKGRMGLTGGATWAWGQNVRTHTLGAFGGSPLVNGNNQAGGFINLKGFTDSETGALKAGDIITITTSNAVYAVNPVDGDVLSTLRQFTVLADCNSDSGGLVTAPIYPPIIASGPYQTVDSTPIDGATVALFGTGGVKSPQMLAFHKEAYAWACVPIDRPKAVEMSAAQTDPETGVSMRIVQVYDGVNELDFWRVDSLCGFVAPRQDWGCRISF